MSVMYFIYRGDRKCVMEVTAGVFVVTGVVVVNVKSVKNDGRKKDENLFQFVDPAEDVTTAEKKIIFVEDNSTKQDIVVSLIDSAALVVAILMMIFKFR